MDWIDILICKHGNVCIARFETTVKYVHIASFEITVQCP
jgi:hypothetical protein